MSCHGVGVALKERGGRGDTGDCGTYREGFWFSCGGWLGVACAPCVFSLWTRERERERYIAGRRLPATCYHGMYICVSTHLFTAVGEEEKHAFRCMQLRRILRRCFLSLLRSRAVWYVSPTEPRLSVVFYDLAPALSKFLIAHTTAVAPHYIVIPRNFLGGGRVKVGVRV